LRTTPNHLAHSRARLAEASELADAGSTDLARVRLVSAADHALIALAAHGETGHHGSRPELERLRELDRDDPRLTAEFGAVQALIDASLAEAHRAPATPMPMYGGPRGAINARGAEAAARGLARIRSALRRR
jgi:hypothetical protein